MSSRKKIVITGASGFLGSHLTERLKDDGGCEVYALSSRPEDLRERIGGSNIEYLRRDAIRDEAAAEMLAGAVVVSCAYPRNSTGTAIADGLAYIRTTFESAVEKGAAGIINISSQSVYSQKRTEEATEETAICLESPYAVGKFAAELLLESVCRDGGTMHTSLRMASLIGPGFDQRIVNRFLLSMLKGEPVTVMRQKKRMGFLDVEDAASAVLAVLNLPADVWKPVYNVGGGRGYTVEQIYDETASVLRERMDVANPVIEEGSDESSSVVGFDRLREDTGFVPEIGLNESIRRILAHQLSREER